MNIMKIKIIITLLGVAFLFAPGLQAKEKTPSNPSPADTAL
jgi:hypothetical protein